MEPAVSVVVALFFGGGMLALGIAIGLRIGERREKLGGAIAETARRVKKIGVFAGDAGKPYGQFSVEVDGEPYNVTVEPQSEITND